MDGLDMLRPFSAWRSRHRISFLLVGSRQGVVSVTDSRLETQVEQTEPVDGLHQALMHADRATYVRLLEECRNVGSLSDGKRIHAHMVKKRVELDEFLGQQLVQMYLKRGSLSEARRVFDEMPNNGVVSWTALIAAYAQNGHRSEAFHLFRKMQLEGVTPNKVTFITILNACNNEADGIEVQSIQSHIAECSLETDVVLGTALVNVCGRYQSLEVACRVFNGLKRRDVISWNAMLSTYVQHQEWKMALKLFHEMQLEGVLPNQITFLAVLNSCASLRDLEEARLVHGHVCESRLESDNMVGNATVDMYGKCGSIGDALKAFEQILEKDVVSWNAILAAYRQNGGCKEALQLFRQMHLQGVKAEKVACATLLHSFASPEFLAEGKLIHAHIVEKGFNSDVVMATALLNMYGKCGSLDDACKTFEGIQKKDVVLWNAIIASLAQADHFIQSIWFFRRMQLEGVPPNKVTFVTIINVCASLSSLEDGRLVHFQIVGSGLGSDTVLGNAIIDLYGKCGSLDEAWKTFERMDRADVVMWTCLLAAFSQHGRFDEAFRLFKQMLLEGIMPSKITYVTVLYACVGWKALAEGKVVHACAVESGLESNEAVVNAILMLYGQCGIEDMCRIFHSKQQQGVMAWNAMIVAHSQQGLHEDACRIFQEMQLEGIVPDKYTLVAVLEAFAQLAALLETQEIDASVANSELEYDDLFNTALLKAYSKCGSLRDASRTFERTARNDVVAWSAMVAVHAQHGHAEEALELFGMMQLYGVMPNDVTFVSFFAACSHSGQVERGYDYFFSLDEDYGIKVTAEHCKCMADLLGRAGRLAEAENFINKMPFEPDIVMWTTLLSACSVHGDLERGERAAEHVLKLDEDNHIAHVMLSNIYSSAGKFKDAANVRQALLDKKLKIWARMGILRTDSESGFQS